jgi:hypothetical protein
VFVHVRTCSHTHSICLSCLRGSYYAVEPDSLDHKKFEARVSAPGYVSADGQRLICDVITGKRLVGCGDELSLLDSQMPVGTLERDFYDQDRKGVAARLASPHAKHGLQYNAPIVSLCVQMLPKIGEQAYVVPILPVIACALLALVNKHQSRVHNVACFASGIPGALNMHPFIDACNAGTRRSQVFCTACRRTRWFSGSRTLSQVLSVSLRR